MIIVFLVILDIMLAVGCIILSVEISKMRHEIHEIESKIQTMTYSIDYHTVKNQIKEIWSDLDTVRKLISEKEIYKSLLKRLYLKDMINDLFTVIKWPEIQELMDCEGFNENAHLINDEIGIAKYGGSAYFVNVNWYKNKGMRLNDPVYYASKSYACECTKQLNTGDVFLFVTNEVNSNDERTFKLVKTDSELECKDCPLNNYDCSGVGCCIKEVV